MSKQKARYTDEEMLNYCFSEYYQSHAHMQQYAQRHSEALLYKMGKMPEDPMDTGIAAVQAVRSVVDQNYQIIKEIVNGSDNSVVRAKSSFIPTDQLNKINFELNAIAKNISGIDRKMEHFIQEALLVGYSHFKVYLERSTLDNRTHEFEDWTEEQIALFEKALESRGFNDIDIKIDSKKTKNKRTTDEERHEMALTGKPIKKSYKLYSGKFNAIAEEVVPKIDYVPMNEVYIHPHTFDSLDDAPYFCHAYMMQVVDGLENGWDEDVMCSSVTGDDASPEWFSDGIIVDKQYNPWNTNPDGFAIQESQDFKVYEHYCNMRYKGKAKKWWKFTTTRTQMLQEPEELEFLPFVSGKIMTLPGSFFGEGLIDIVKPIQDQLTYDFRMLNYNAANKAFGRHIAVTDMYNKASLEDMRPGGVVEVDDIGAVQLLPEADISQALEFSISTKMEQLQSLVNGSGKLTDDASAMAETSGVSVSMLINKAEQGPKAYCATLTETALVPLYKKLYQILWAQEHPIDSIAPGVTLKDFPKDLAFTFDISTTTDKQQSAQNVMSSLMNAEQLWNGGNLPSFITEQNIYEAVKANIQAGTGDGNVDTYLTDPSKIQPSKREIVQQDVSFVAGMITTQSAAEAAHLENQKALSEIQWNEAKTANEVATMKATATKTAQDEEVFNLKRDQLRLQNQLLAMQVAETGAQTELTLAQADSTATNVQYDGIKLQSELIAEENQIVNGEYAMGAM